MLRAEIEETGEIVVDFRDVTRAKELEEAKDLFLATTSHELRTPITVVRGFAGMLDTRWDGLSDAERRSAVHTIAERARSLGQLMDHLLLGSRAGAGKIVLTLEAFDLGELIKTATLGLPVLSEVHRVEVVVPDDLPKVYGDALATDIVLGQLLENAFKYSPDGGLIKVEAWPDGDRVVVVVDDEGWASPRPTGSASSNASSRPRAATAAGSAGSASASTSCAASPRPRAGTWRPTRGRAAAPGCVWNWAGPTRQAPVAAPARRSGNEPVTVELIYRPMCTSCDRGTVSAIG
nr:hypothetical protein GCM10020093_077010 [Planobispora longispora]